MKTNVRVVYNRYKKLNKEGKAAIVIEISFDRLTRKIINTNIYIRPDQWNDKTKEVNNKYSAHIQANIYIRDMVSEILNFELQLLNQGKQLTPEILDKFNKGQKGTVKYFYEFALEEFSKEKMSIGTYNKNRSILKKLQRYTPKATFADINYQYILDVDAWLNAQQQNTSLNTVSNYHKMIKKYLNVAINLGYIKHEQNPYNHFKVKKSPTTKTNLTEGELEKFKNVKIDNPFVQKIQDIFVFACYTGLRYQDLVNLQKKHFDIVGDQVTIIIDKMQKTKRPVELPLHLLFGGKAIDIFNKYYTDDMDFLFGEPMTNQYLNRELKFIAKVVGLTHKNITMHMARHTFGSLLAEKTGDAYLIKDLMGHADIKMSMEYVHGSRKAKNDKLNKVEW